ncbi:hypothetical protein MMC27_000863 [Xylographa pallens]|nr:hypothetical protein [Xylographa pallens]
MKNQCPLLKELDITIRKRPFDSSEILIPATGLPEYLLEATRCLTKITLQNRQRRTEIWSSEVFLALAQNQHIRSFTVPNILAEWTLNLQGFPPGTYFRKINRITTSIDESALAMLAPHISDVVKLDLKVYGPSLRLIATVASLPALVFLRLSFDGCNGTGAVRGEDLMLLAKNCPGLFILHIIGNGLLTSVDINDATMDGMARGLPNLIDLKLHLLGGSLTENALLSLGHRCPGLKSCSITARVNYEDLFNIDQENLFPALRILQTYQREPMTCPSDPVGIASRLQQAAPLLDCLHYYDDDCTFENFDEFREAIREAYGDRCKLIDMQPMIGSGSR